MRLSLLALLGTLVVCPAVFAGDYACDGQTRNGRSMEMISAASEQEALAKLRASHPEITSGARCIPVNGKASATTTPAAPESVPANAATQSECRKLRGTIESWQNLDPKRVIHVRDASGNPVALDAAARKKREAEMQAEIAAKCPASQGATQ